jgi:hypothetical protein
MDTRHRARRAEIEPSRYPRLLAVLGTAAAIAILLATSTGAMASAPPVGALPPGPVSSLVVVKGEPFAIALPHSSGGRVWRIARPFDSRVVGQVSEADVGSNVVLVFRASGTGTTTVAFGLTRGERAKAYASRRFVIHVH